MARVRNRRLVDEHESDGGAEGRDELSARTSRERNMCQESAFTQKCSNPPGNTSRLPFRRMTRAVCVFRQHADPRQRRFGHSLARLPQSPSPRARNSDQQLVIVAACRAPRSPGRAPRAAHQSRAAGFDRNACPRRSRRHTRWRRPPAEAHRPGHRSNPSPRARPGPAPPRAPASSRVGPAVFVDAARRRSGRRSRSISSPAAAAPTEPLT